MHEAGARAMMDGEPRGMATSGMGGGTRTRIERIAVLVFAMEEGRNGGSGTEGGRVEIGHH